MSLSNAAGFPQFPNGNYRPEIWSKKVLKFFKRISVADAISNTDYEGEIAEQGDTVRIMKQPVVTVSDYKRGENLSSQFLADEEVQLVVDQAKYYQFLIEDTQARQTHLDWSEMANDAAAYSLRNVYDQEVLQKCVTGSSSSTAIQTLLGSDGSAKTIGFGSSNDYKPLDFLASGGRAMDENNIPLEGRFFVAAPSFYQQLVDEDSNFTFANRMGLSKSELLLKRPDFLATDLTPHGFTMLMSNNLPLDTSGNPVTLFGHTSATAVAKQLVKDEVIRSENTFAWKHRGLMLWGSKVIRPEAMFTGYIANGDV